MRNQDTKLPVSLLVASALVAGSATGYFSYPLGQVGVAICGAGVGLLCLFFGMVLWIVASQGKADDSKSFQGTCDRIVLTLELFANGVSSRVASRIVKEMVPGEGEARETALRRANGIVSEELKRFKDALVAEGEACRKDT